MLGKVWKYHMYWGGNGKLPDNAPLWSTPKARQRREVPGITPDNLDPHARRCCADDYSCDWFERTALLGLPHICVVTGLAGDRAREAGRQMFACNTQNVAVFLITQWLWCLRWTIAPKQTPLGGYCGGQIREVPGARLWTTNRSEKTVSSHSVFHNMAKGYATISLFFTWLPRKR